MSTLTPEAFSTTAAHCESASHVAVVDHRAGSAVYDRLNAASRVTAYLRPAFRPKLAVLLRLWLFFWRFHFSKLSLVHLFVLDTVVPRTDPATRLDQIVRQIGYEI